MILFYLKIVNPNAANMANTVNNSLAKLTNIPQKENA